MKLKRILYCTLSLVVALCFLPGCELFLMEPKKEWPCGVIPKEPPTEYGNFVAFRVDGVPYVYTYCPSASISGPLIMIPHIRSFEGEVRFHAFSSEQCDTTTLIRRDVTFEFMVPEDYTLGESIELDYFGITYAPHMVETAPHEVRLVAYDKEERTCRGYFSASVTYEQENGILSDTISITDGVFSVMFPFKRKG